MNLKIVVSLLVFCGLLCGLLLKKIAPEEAMQGKRYLRLFEISIIIALLLTFFSIIIPFLKNFYIIFFLFFGYASFYFLKNEYVVIGLSSTMSFFFFRENTLFINALNFMYGLPYGSLVNLSKNRYKKIILAGIFFYLPFLLFIGKDFTSVYLEYIVFFEIGMLLHLLKRKIYKFRRN